MQKDILAIKWEKKEPSWTQIYLHEGKLWKQDLEFNVKRLWLKKFESVKPWFFYHHLTNSLPCKDSFNIPIT